MSIIFFGSAIFSSAAHAAVYDFQATTISRDVDNAHWSSFAASSNKMSIIIANKGGRLYFTNNGGTDWVETRPVGDTDQNWKLVDIDVEGNKMVAATEMGRIYYSPDAGTNWSELQPAGNVDKNWSFISVEKNGNIICAVNGGRIYSSNNEGSTWSELQPAGDVDKNWSKVVYLRDINEIVAISNPGRAYYSIDAGTNWSEVRPVGDVDKNWSLVNVSREGNKIILGSKTGRVYKYDITLETTTEIRPKGDQDGNWQSLVTGDSDYYFVSENTGRLFFSEDNVVWSEARPGGNSDKVWNDIAIANDGLTLYALEESGGLYSMTYSYRVPSAPSNVQIQTNSTAVNKIYGRAVYKTTELQVSTSTIFKLAHGTTRVGNKMYLGTRTDPAKIVVFNDANDLSNYQAVNVTGYKDIEVMVYDQVHNRLYGMLYDSNVPNKLEIISINPDNIADYQIVYQTNSIPFAGGGPIATDGTYLYGATTGHPVTIYKIRISDWTLVAQTNWADATMAHSAQIYNYNDRCELYLTSVYIKSYFAKVNCSDLSYAEVALGDETLTTDDFAFKYKNESGGTVYIGLEGTDRMYTVDTATMTAASHFGLRSYGVFNGGDSIYNLNFIGGYITKYSNFDVNNYKVYVFPGETPNEFFIKDNKKFITHWGDVGYLKEYGETNDLYATSTVSFTWTNDVTDAVFDVSYSSNGIDYSPLSYSRDTTSTVALLQPNTQYWFKIYAVNGLASSTPTIFSTTTPMLVAAQVASVPASVSVSLDTNNNATISWAANGSDAYYVYDNNGTASDWISSTSYTYSGLACGDYNYYVKGRNVDGVETAVASTTLSITCGLRVSSSTINLYRSGDSFSNKVSLSLMSPPSSSVVLTPVFSNGAVGASNGGLTFSVSNWNVPQDFVFYSVPNTTLTQATLGFSVSSLDINYNSGSFATVTINIINFVPNNSGGGGTSLGCSGLCGGGSSAPPVINVSPAQTVPVNQSIVVASPIQTAQVSTNYVANNTSASLVIPAGTISAPATLEIKAKESGSVPLPQPTEVVVSEPTRPVGDVVFDISLKDNATNANITSFSSSNLQLTINIPTISSSEDITTLGLYYLNETTNQWIRVDNASFNLLSKQVTASLNHLTKFAVFKSTDKVLNTEETKATNLNLIPDDKVQTLSTTTPVTLPKLTTKQLTTYKGKFIKDKNNNSFYIDPKTKKLESVTKDNAIKYLAKTAVGIKNKDLIKINNLTDKKVSIFSKKFSNKVLIAIEDKGTLWYVNKDGRKTKVYDGMGLLKVLAIKI